jgi:hypothetical protein
MATVVAGFLGLVLGQAANEPLYQRTFEHRIPFNIDPKRRTEINAVQLYMSPDEGKSWQLHSTVTPDRSEFLFHAPNDGVYWFRIASLDLKNKQQPDNIYLVKDDATIKMVIDSLKPVVKLVAQRQEEEVAASWDITEEHPDPKTLVLEYQVQGSPSWLPVKIAPAQTGTAPVRPGSTAPLTFRMTFTDRAGNQAQKLVEVPGTTVTMAAFAPVGNPPPAQPGTQPAPAAQSGTSPIPPVLPPAVSPTTPTAQAPPLPPPPASQEVNVHPLVNPPALNPDVLRNDVPRNSPLPPPGEIAPMPPASSKAPLVASSENVGGPRVASFSGARPLPAIRHVNHPQMALTYEITLEGPSHVGSVDLWWTPDDGKTWERSKRPDEMGNPEDLVVDGRRRQRIIDLKDGDGIYGFALVIRSRAGLGKAEPRAGDVPEMRIELDTVKPLAKLFKPQADPQHRDSLILTWIAQDKNLSPAPVTLEWSQLPTGGWQPIGTNLANTGQYVWQLPPNMPVQVYLRIQVKDLAGNIGEAVTQEPQLVDLTEPEGHLVDVAPAGRRP